MSAGMRERRPEPVVCRRGDGRRVAVVPLLALSMVMTSSRDETEILHIITTTVPSLGGCRVGAVYLDGGWQATIKAPEFPRPGPGRPEDAATGAQLVETLCGYLTYGGGGHEVFSEEPTPVARDVAGRHPSAGRWCRRHGWTRWPIGPEPPPVAAGISRLPQRLTLWYPAP